MPFTTEEVKEYTVTINGPKTNLVGGSIVMGHFHAEAASRGETIVSSNGSDETTIYIRITATKDIVEDYIDAVQRRIKNMKKRWPSLASDYKGIKISFKN